MPRSNDPHEYRDLMERMASVTDRLQVDLMDGQFAPNKNIAPVQLWWPENTQVDIHLMYTNPAKELTTLISLRPHMIIFHYESNGDIEEYINHVKHCGIKAGVALLPQTPVAYARAAIQAADHVLIFGGALGESGVADLAQLDKVPAIRAINPGVEIGWDGGANIDTVTKISAAGVNVINVGSAISDAHDATDAYRTLTELVGSAN